MKKSFLLRLVLGFVCLIFANPVRAINLSSVVGIWVFDSDKDMSDISGNGHDGVEEGEVKWVDGKFGKAVELDGSNAVIVEHADDMNLESFTLMAWINIPNAPTDWWTVASKDGWPDRNYGIWLASGTGLAHHSWTSGAAPDNNAVNAVTPVIAGEWHHLAATYDLKVSKLYINGKLDVEGNFNAKPNVTDVEFIVGRTANGSYKYIGIIDEVGLFNQALSEEDINSIMGSGLKVATSVESKGKLATTWADVKSK